ncbi:MAG: flagellar hook-length control protein FliK [Paralcaligenes sp.]
MTTVTIPAISSSANNAAGPVSQNGSTANNPPNTSFSDVLSNQQTPPQTKLAQPARTSTDKTSHAKDDALDSNEGALALLASGLAQPQLAPHVTEHALSPGSDPGQATQSASTDSSSATRIVGANTASAAANVASSSYSGISPQAITQTIQEQLDAARPSEKQAIELPDKQTIDLPGSGDRTNHLPTEQPKDNATDSQKAGTPASVQGVPILVNVAAQLVNSSSPNPPDHIKPGHPLDDGPLQSVSIASDNGLSGALNANPAQFTTSSSASLQINTPLQHPQWADDFSQQFVTLTSHQTQNQTAELHINPPDLGPLHISINLSDNTANAIFMSPHAAVRSAVENALPQLQQALAQSGISLGQTNVSDQRQPAGRFQETSTQKRRTSTGTVGNIGSTTMGVMARTSAGIRVPNALIDTFI